MAYIGRENNGFGVRSRFIYTATGGQTTFNTDDSGNALSYSDGAYVDVYLNGVLLDPADYTDTSLTSIVLGSGATASDILEVIVYDVFSVFSGTFTTGITAGDATITGDLTVDTTTLKVDSTNNRVGIGTTSPASTLDVQGTALMERSRLSSNDGTTYWDLRRDSSTGHFVISDDGLGDVVLIKQDTGNVGIGLTDPDTPLEVQIGSSGNALKLSSSADGASVFLAFEQQESGTKHVRGRIRAASNGVEGGLIFETGASSSTSERMRIDNSGRLLVGKTTNAIGTAGHTLQADGFFSATRSASQCAGFNRLSDDGNVVEIRKDGTLVGSIGTVSGDVFFAGVDSNHAALRFAASSKTVLPVTTAGALSDNTTDLGQSNAQFDDIFASNSTIQPSDQIMKQDIASLTSAEITAAKAISKLFKTFKWKDKVTSKGDSARTHAGVIAQEVQSAMSDAGLDATKYAFFCSDTWYETYTDVPAVEANEENGTEAQDAYTRTDTYNTADEAPEGATEKTRLGIRYPELLAFVGAATEQRLTSIEARLTALENA